jgi:hypothetical protein
MKTTFRILIVLVLSFIVLFPTTMASAKQNRIEFTGSELCTHADLEIPMEWYPGRNWQARDASETCFDTNADTSMMTGTDYIYDMSCRYVGEGNFMLEGKLRMETDEGGVWVGSWEMSAHDYVIKVVAHGEGVYEGMHLHWFLYQGDTTTTPEGDITPFNGYITYQEDQ